MAEHDPLDAGFNAQNGTLDFRGIFLPITTPFLDDEVSLDNLERNVQMWLISPAAGFVVLGTTGEFPHLTFDEKLAVVEAAVAAAEDRPVIAGTGANSTRETIALTEAAAEQGVRAVLVGTPYYYHYRPELKADALYDHFTAVADASPVPVLLYNYPARTGIVLDPELVLELAQHPNIAGMKDSSRDLAMFTEYAAVAPEDFALLTGSASLLLPALTMGARGGILALANVAPWECCELYDLVRESRMEEAAALQRRLSRVNAKLSQYGIPGIKALLTMLGYFGGEPRRPMLPLSQDELDDIRATLKDVRMLGC